HFGLALPASFALLGVGFALGRIYQSSVEHAFVGLIAGAAFILLLWLVRRMFYVRFQPQWGAIGGAIYLVTVVASVYALKTLHQLSTLTAFLAMAVASLAASAVLLFQIRPERIQASGDPSFGMVIADHWRYGRWSLATAAVSWIPLNVYYALLPAWIGLSGAG